MRRKTKNRLKWVGSPMAGVVLLSGRLMLLRAWTMIGQVERKRRMVTWSTTFLLFLHHEKFETVFWGPM